jgi:hypothetical protein
VPPLTAGTTYVIVLSSFNGFSTGTFRYAPGRLAADLVTDVLDIENVGDQMSL